MVDVQQRVLARFILSIPTSIGANPVARAPTEMAEHLWKNQRYSPFTVPNQKKKKKIEIRETL